VAQVIQDRVTRRTQKHTFLLQRLPVLHTYWYQYCLDWFYLCELLIT